MSDTAGQSAQAQLRARVQLLLWRTHFGVSPAVLDTAFARAQRDGYAAAVQ